MNKMQTNRRTKALLVFVVFLVLTVVTPLVFIQTKTFAKLLSRFIQAQVLKDFGIDGTFSDLSVKLIPPGVVIRNPSISLQEKNIVNLPQGTSVMARQMEATFEFVQLLTGEVNIQGVVLDGADINLKIDKEFISRLEKKKRQAKTGDKSHKLTWDAVFQFNFKSLGLTNTKLSLEFLPGDRKESIRLVSFARELTVGKSAGKATDKTTPVYDIGLDLGETRIESKKLAYRVTQVHASAEMSAKSVRLKSFAAQDETRTIYFDGNIKGNVLDPKTLDSDFNYIFKGPLSKWISDPLLARFVKIPAKFDGAFKLEGTASVDLLRFPDELKTRAAMELEAFNIAGWSGKKILMDLEWNEPNLKLNTSEVILTDGGLIRFSSIDSIEPMNDSLKFPVHADFENVDFHQLMGPMARQVYPLRSKISGRADAELTLTNTIEFDSSVDLILRQFSLDNQKQDEKKPLHTLLAIPEIKLRAGIKLNKGAVTLTGVLVSLPNTSLTAKGTIGPDKGIDLDITGKVDLKDVGRLAIADIRGTGQVHWTVKGKPDDVIFTFEPDIKDGQYLNLKLGDVKGWVIYDDGKSLLKFKNLHTRQGRFEGIANGQIDLGQTDNIHIDVQVPTGTVQDFAHFFSKYIEQSAPWYRWDTKGMLWGHVLVSGKTDLDELMIIGNMQTTNLEILGETFKGGHFKAGFDKGDLFASDINWIKKTGQVSGGVRYKENSELSFDFKSKHLTTMDFDIFSKWDLPYKANLSIEGSGQGLLGSLKAKSRIYISPGTIKNYVMPESELLFENSNGHLLANMNVFNGKLTAKSDYQWQEGLSSTLQVDYKKFDFIPLLAILNPALIATPGTSSEVSAKADVMYKTGSLSRLNGDLVIEHAFLKRPGALIRLENPVAVKFNNGDYRFDDVTFKGESTHIAATGNVTEGLIRYDFGGHVNLKILELLVPEIAASNGEAYFNGTLRGRAQAADFATEVKVKEADLRLASLKQPFENLRYQVNWKDNRAVVSDIAAQYASGKITGSGSVEVYPDKPPKLDFSFALDNPKIQVFPVAYARSNGKLTLKGESFPYVIKGNVSVAEALVKQSFDVGQGRVLKSSRFLPQGGDATGSFSLIELDVDVNADHGFLIKNDLFDADLKCNLKIIKSIKSPGILGQVLVNSGKLLFKDNYFTVQSGNVRFINPAVIDPEFDMTGVTEAKGYKVTMVAVGKVSDYKITFQSQPPLSQNDIVNLLTLGVTSSGYQNLGSANKEAYTRDEMVGLIFNQSPVNKSLKDKLGVNVKLDQSSDTNLPASVFRSQSGTDVGATISPKVVVQKQISKTLSVSAGTTVGVGDSRQQDVKLDLDVVKNVSVSGVYEDQGGALPQNSRTSIGVDAKYKVRFK